MNKKLPIWTIFFCGFFALLYSNEVNAQSVDKIANDVSKSVVMIHVFDVTGSRISQGSGVFVTDNGIILTNSHVLKNAFSAEIISDIGKYETVKILYQNEKSDLALIKVETSQSIPPKFAINSDYKPGHRVIAIGNPLGFEKTVSDGLISGIRRIENGVELIQTTVPISPGSSGGVLLNEKGEVIGITSSTFKGGQNINFAVGMSSIQSFVREYKNYDPEGQKYQELRKAREKKWYRVVLKWIIGIISFIIGVLFSEDRSSYFIILIVVMVLYGIYVGMRWLITFPYRYIKNRRLRNALKNIEKNKHLSNNITTDEKEIEHELSTVGEKPKVFHCWKCGSQINVDKEYSEKEVTCESCLTRLKIPINA